MCFINSRRLTPPARPPLDIQVIHFTATQQFFFGFEYVHAYRRALQVTSVVPSAATSACGAPVQPPVALCG